MPAPLLARPPRCGSLALNRGWRCGGGFRDIPPQTDLPSPYIGGGEAHSHKTLIHTQEIEEEPQALASS
jgi:hypothetical protein